MADSSRRSGEIPVDVVLTELGRIHQSFGERFDALSAQLNDQTGRVDRRLAEGDKTMALLRQTLETLVDDVKSQNSHITSLSSTIHKIELNQASQKPREENTHRATPALEPKAEPPWINRAMRKGAETAIGSAASLILIGLILWIVRGNLRGLVDTSPSAPTPVSTTPDR